MAPHSLSAIIVLICEMAHQRVSRKIDNIYKIQPGLLAVPLQWHGFGIGLNRQLLLTGECLRCPEVVRCAVCKGTTLVRIRE